MQLKSNTVYHHDEREDVLVLDVHHVFEEYDLETMEGVLTSRVVRFTEQWDDYGPISSTIRVTPVDEFRTAVGDPIRTVEFVDPDEEPERP